MCMWDVYSKEKSCRSLFETDVKWNVNFHHSSISLREAFFTHFSTSFTSSLKGSIWKFLPLKSYFYFPLIYAKGCSYFFFFLITLKVFFLFLLYTYLRMKCNYSDRKNMEREFFYLWLLFFLMHIILHVNYFCFCFISCLQYSALR